MLEHECALATGDDWIHQIDRIGTGSRVLLYANKSGIIAVGIATAEKRNIAWEDSPGRFVKLCEFRKLKSPFAAASIRKIAGNKNYPLLQTLIKLPGQIGEDVWNKCVALT
jgi:hypothetical protein